MDKNHTLLKIDSLDENMGLDNLDIEPFIWLDPMEAPFKLTGFPWISKDRVYRRLPLEARDKLSQKLDTLAYFTAGGQIHFQTDSRKLALRVQLTNKANMYHMAATGQCGFDCYIGPPNKQLYISTAKYDHTQKEYECLMYEFSETRMHNITLNFPLYQAVEKVLIGVEKGAELLPPIPLRDDKKLVFYGSSITQGGCASRPGMAYTNIISRRLGMECVNLGFSGNGKGEPEMAEIITEIENPACIILDYEANSKSGGILEKTLPEFIRIIRSNNAKVPILVLSKIKYAKENFFADMLNRRIELCRFQAEIVEELQAKGDTKIHFYDGSYLLGDNAHECTVDGIHPNDLGFMNIAERLLPVLRNIIGYC